MKKSILIILAIILCFAALSLTFIPFSVEKDDEATDPDNSVNDATEPDDSTNEDPSGDETDQTPDNTEPVGSAPFSVWKLKEGLSSIMGGDGDEIIYVDFTYLGTDYTYIQFKVEDTVDDHIYFDSFAAYDLGVWYASRYLCLPSVDEMSAETVTALSKYADMLEIAPVKYKVDYDSYNTYANDYALYSEFFMFVSNGTVFNGIDINYLPMGGYFYYVGNETNNTLIETFVDGGFASDEYSYIYVLNESGSTAVSFPFLIETE